MARTAPYIPFIIPLILLIGASDLFPQANYDLWFHLQLGKEIVDTHRVPHADYHSFTRLGVPYRNVEWLSDVIFYIIYRATGEGWQSAAFGLVTLKLVLSALMMILVFRAASRAIGSPSDSVPGSLAVAAFLCAVGALGMTNWLSIRPHLFTFCGLALLLNMLEDYRTRCARGDAPGWTIWLLIPLFVLWVNLHGGFWAGIGFLGIYLLAWWAESLLRHPIAREEPGGNGGPSRSDEDTLKVEIKGAETDRVQDEGDTARGPLVRLTFVAALALAATLINPYGFGTWATSFYVGHASDNLVAISEWLSPDFHSWDSLGFLVLLIVAFGITSLSAVRSRWSHTALLIMTMAMALRSMRHIPLFVICAPVCLGRNVRDLLQSPLGQACAARSKRLGRWRWMWRGSYLFVVGVMVYLGFMSAIPKPTQWFEYQSGMGMMPNSAIEFIRSNPFSGRMQNAYEWGGYLMWALPQHRVFQDGRAELYFPDVNQQSLDLLHGEANSYDILADYNISWVLASNENSLLPRLLTPEKGWRTIYADPVAVIIVRNTPENKPLISRSNDAQLLPRWDALADRQAQQLQEVRSASRVRGPQIFILTILAIIASLLALSWKAGVPAPGRET